MVIVVGTEVGGRQSKSLQGQPAEQFSWMIKHQIFFGYIDVGGSGGHMLVTHVGDDMCW